MFTFLELKPFWRQLFLFFSCICVLLVSYWASLFHLSFPVVPQVWRAGWECGGLRAGRPQRSAKPSAANGQRVEKLAASAHSDLRLQRGPTDGCAAAGNVAPKPKGLKLLLSCTDIIVDFIRLLNVLILSTFCCVCSWLVQLRTSSCRCAWIATPMGQTTWRWFPTWSRSDSNPKSCSTTTCCVSGPWAPCLLFNSIQVTNASQLNYSRMIHGWCCRELLNAHRDNLGTMVKLVIFNELSNARNPNNMQVLHTVLQHSPEQAPKVNWRTVQIAEWNTSNPLRWDINSSLTRLYCGCSSWRWCSRTFSPIRRTTCVPHEPYWEKSSSRPSTRSTSSPFALAWCRRERSPVTLTWNSKWASSNKVKQTQLACILLTTDGDCASPTGAFCHPGDGFTDRLNDVGHYCSGQRSRHSMGQRREEE